MHFPITSVHSAAEKQQVTLARLETLLHLSGQGSILKHIAEEMVPDLCILRKL